MNGPCPRAAMCALTLFVGAKLHSVQAQDLDADKDDIPLRTEWISENDREPIKQLNVRFTNQDGETGVLEDLVDRPTLITMFYTRCQNNYKCSAALTRFTALQQILQEKKLDDDVRLLAITYEPDFDDAERIRRFGADRGLKFTDNSQALRLDSVKHQGFVKALKAPVSFSGGAVNTHGVALHVLDANGQLVRQYHTLLWDNDQVLQDLQVLLDEGN